MIRKTACLMIFIAISLFVLIVPVQANHTDSGNMSKVGVEVGLGQQLGVLISVSSDEVQTEVENHAFEFRLRRGEKKEALRERLNEIHSRSEEVRREYKELKESLKNGGISRGEYARSVAALNSKAENLKRSLELLRTNLNDSSEEEVNRSMFNSTVGNIRELTGLAPSALLSRFTGTVEGTVEIDTRDGVSIEVESEGGESSREVRRERDENNSITVNASVARQNAVDSLSNRSWVFVEENIHEKSGYIEFEFVLNANNTEGEAEVRVDGSTGTVFRIEEEIEPADEVKGEVELEVKEEDEDRDKKEEKEDDGVGEKDEEERKMEEGDAEEESREDKEVKELSLELVSGTPEPNSTVTVQVLADGSPTGNTSIKVNGKFSGETGYNGTHTLTLPGDTDEVRITADRGDEDAELRFEFEEEEEDNEDGY